MTLQQQILTEYLRAFPDAATRTLALKAVKEHPKVFLNAESARSAIRHLRGASGKRGRKSLTIREHMRPVQKPGDPFARIPSAKRAFKKKWGPVQIAGPIRCLVLCDVHVPYHDRDALRAALEYGREQQATHVLLNGDFVDCFSISRWEPNPEQRDFKAELKAGREMLALIREGFPDARIIYKLGNHEERWEKYMALKAPELLNVSDFQFEKLWNLAEFGIELVGEMRPIRLGKLNVIHGHEYKYNISNPVNPARGYYNRAKAHCLAGHLHQTSQHSEGDIEGRSVAVWSVGCLCDLKPAYSPLNKWNHGVAFVTVEKNGAFEVENLRIVDGKIYK